MKIMIFVLTMMNSVSLKAVDLMVCEPGKSTRDLSIAGMYIHLTDI